MSGRIKAQEVHGPGWSRSREQQAPHTGPWTSREWTFLVYPHSTHRRRGRSRARHDPHTGLPVSDALMTLV